MNTMKTHATVLAVDVGYGNTKVAVRNGSEVSTFMFPSLTPDYQAKTMTKQSNGVLKAVRTVGIEVNGKQYEVGPEVPLTSRNGDPGRTLVGNYCTTDSYEALLGGAFHFANVSSVDRLVLGLPVQTFQQHAEALRSKFSGTLQFGDEEVRVGNLMVLPQPLGALVHFSQHPDFTPSQRNMIIDVGYYTTDWVVAKGLTMEERRSGGHQSGASHFFQKMAELIGAATNESALAIEEIDEAVRAGTPYYVFNEEINLGHYAAQAQSVPEAAVNAIGNSVGSTNDIRCIFLTGGGAALYEPAIRAFFPRNRIEVVKNACFSNVRGFFAAGEATLMRERDKKRKEAMTA
ncbi:plasmid segregation actin-type ATPase ParM [Caballeronia arationis]|uniref:Plasmid segregation actin-type ATPase ParM n=1 Tax=Caballeronia arationis TaxID=1777142 RepID=A0A7Z7N788_9BURK|nr:PRTRC system protein D [Caballeronia arationis]SOE91581.1 plasmid segregation actin-type ATPase ParM [Caballeronia arationis]